MGIGVLRPGAAGCGGGSTGSGAALMAALRVLRRPMGGAAVCSASSRPGGACNGATKGGDDMASRHDMGMSS